MTKRKLRIADRENVAIGAEPIEEIVNTKEVVQKDSNEIAIDETTRNMLQTLTENAHKIQGQIQTIIQVYLNAKGATGDFKVVGNYEKLTSSKE